MRTADWLAQGLILRKIKENCRYSIKTNLDEGKKNNDEISSKLLSYDWCFINGRWKTYNSKSSVNERNHSFS
jgi:hypothetical protein